MGRTPCCDKTKVKRGQWSPEEDEILKNHILNHGNAGSWITLPNRAGSLSLSLSFIFLILLLV